MTDHKWGVYKRGLRAVLSLLAVVLFTVGAAAQQGSSDSASRAAAQALFDQGRALMQKKQYDEACPKLEASNKLDPGVGTLLYLGDCYEKAGKLASSWAAFEEAASLGTTRGEMDRVKVAKVRAVALKPRVPMLVFVVDNPVPGLEVRRDGALIPQASWGSPLPVDAGDTQVIASAPGYHAWQQTVSVPASLKEPWPVRVPTLEKEATTAPAVVAPPPVAPAPVKPQPSKPANDGSTQRTVGLIVGGAGVVGLIVSGTLTILAANKKANSKDDCLPNSPNQCSPAGVSARQSATSLANVATVAGVVGGVAVAGGAVIYFTAPKSENATSAGSAVPQGLVLNMEARF
ncbi:MAG TPA: hypothetical protein VL137_00250 [Polyangiaceae bacterium]|nr:hypothetical protein [Polyangiaceae bacterium]